MQSASSAAGSYGLQAGLRDLLQGVCCTTCKPVMETCCKEVCKTCYKQCVETCYKTCIKTVCKPVTMKTVQQKCGEWCTEQYCVPGKCKYVCWQKVCG